MAIETSTKQMALFRNVEFMERVQAILAQAAGVVLNEPLITPFHLERALYAKQVVITPLQSTIQAGPQIVMGINVVNTTIYDEITKTSECSILDIDLEAQINTLWNALGGIDTAV